MAIYQVLTKADTIYHGEIKGVWRATKIFFRLQTLTNRQFKPDELGNNPKHWLLKTVLALNQRP